MAYDEKTAGRVRNALSGRRDVVEKNLMGGLCFMTKGGMCCSVSGGGGGAGARGDRGDGSRAAGAVRRADGNGRPRDARLRSRVA